ncbi:MAG: hypothetical protein E7645_07785 [Ruminococcaceae bacterium]|nr:hypothetical protein [Oscillospiraceae bacterium]
MNYNPYEPPRYDMPSAYPPAPPKQPARGLSIASMVCGIVSIPILSLAAAVCALVFGLVAKKKKNTSGMATAGVVCGIIGTVLSVIAIIVTIVMILPYIISHATAQQSGLTFKAHGEDIYYVDRLAKDHPEHVVIPETYMGKPVTAIDMYAFMNRPNLKSVTIPDSVTVIAGKAFENCTALEEVRFSSNLKEIAGRAFYNCTSLTSVNLPDSLTYIGENAFGGCTSLSSLSLPHGLEILDIGAFHGCTSLTEVTIPSTVLSSDEYEFFYFNNDDKGPFQDCTALRKVTLLCDSSIMFSTFRGCTSLSEVVFGSNFETLYNSAFADCVSLKTLSLPEGLKHIYPYAFANSGLTEITVPDSVTSVGYRAFAGCTALKEIFIPESVLHFGDEVFKDCTALTSAILPSTIDAYEVKNTFEGCTSLTYFKGCAVFVSKFGSGSKTVTTAILSGVSTRNQDPDNKYNTQYITLRDFDVLNELTLSVPNFHIFVSDSYMPQLRVIHFGGTKKEWDNISFYKHHHMKHNVTVHCTDGDVIEK